MFDDLVPVMEHTPLSDQERHDRPSAMRGEFLAGPGVPGLVSVIVPAFNREELVLDTLNSLKQQSYAPLQIIVVDDGSSDRTSEVVRQWQDENDRLWLDLLRQPNRGVAGARNAGLRAANGEFVYFLDSDDTVEPEALATLMQTLKAAPHAPFALGRVTNNDLDGRPIAGDFSGITHMREGNILRNHWLLFAALYRREAIARAGPFNEALVMGEDTELNWRIVFGSGVGVRCDIVTGQRRHHGQGHLYLDSSVDERMRRSLEMHEALADWIADRPDLQRQVTVNGLFGMNNFYHRLGRDESDALWERVAKLFVRLSPQNPRTAAIFRWFAQPQNRSKFRFLYRLYRMPRRAIVLTVKPCLQWLVTRPAIEKALGGNWLVTWAKGQGPLFK